MRGETTSEGPDSSQSERICASPHTASRNPPRRRSSEPIVGKPQSSTAELCDRQRCDTSPLFDFEGGVSQMAELAPADEICLLSSWCAQGVAPRKSIDKAGHRNASCDTLRLSPSTITQSVCAKLKELQESCDILGPSLREDCFSARERDMYRITCNFWN